jgi:hypothetical protein
VEDSNGHQEIRPTPTSISAPEPLSRLNSRTPSAPESSALPSLPTVSRVPESSARPSSPIASQSQVNLPPAVKAWYAQNARPRKQLRRAPVDEPKSPVAQRTRGSLKRSISKDSLIEGDLNAFFAEEGSENPVVLKMKETLASKYSAK